MKGKKKGSALRQPDPYIKPKGSPKNLRSARPVSEPWGCLPRIAVIILISIFFTLTAPAQYNWKKALIPAGMSFLAGAAWGTHEATMHHWPEVARKYPNLNPKFWNPAISHTMPEVMGYKFDAKHLLASGNQVLLFGAGLTITIGERRPGWHHLADIGISAVAYSLGNFATYNLIF